jgi:hypothetical protein
LPPLRRYTICCFNVLSRDAEYLHPLCRYTNCAVSFAKGALSGQATTNAAGAFAIPVPGANASEYPGGLASMTPGAGCIDALTRLPAPFALGALVPDAAGALQFPVIPACMRSHC